MSSDDFYGSINSSDISRLREALTSAGFRYADPMTDGDRDAARFVIAQHQQGARSLVDMRSALAQRALLAGILLAPSREASI